MRQMLLLLLLAAVFVATARCEPLDTGADTRDRGGETALLKAARLGRIGLMRQLLAVPGVDAGAADGKGRTALHHAAQSGSATMVELLLNATGADVNAIDSDGHTPLYYAINGSQPHVAMALLDVPKIDALARDPVNDTALHWAARVGHTALVFAVLERAPALLNAVGDGGRTALAIAVHKGDTETAMRLLNVSSVRLHGALDSANVLHCAAAGGHARLVRTMLAIAETDVNARDAGDATALMAAVWAGHKDTTDALLAANGIDVAAQDAQGRTAVMLAVERDDAELLALILSSDGVDDCAKECHGCAHRCVNTATDYRCECYAGHELKSDGRNCTGLRYAVEGSCGGLVTGRSGTITSPNYPAKYAPNTRCTWDIVAPNGHVVYWDFTHIDMDDCSGDVVDLISTDRSRKKAVFEHGNYCGAPAPDRIASVTDRLKVVFASDHITERSGFSGRYFTAPCADAPADSECVRDAYAGMHADHCLRGG